MLVFYQCLSYFKKLLFNIFLRRPFLRSRIIFELKQNYYNELKFFMTVGEKWRCPIFSQEDKFSFQEIFIELEYALLVQKIPLPTTWLDIGCHAGYFSLWLACLREKNGLEPNFKALLIDGDSRIIDAVNELITLNGFEKKMIFKHAAVSRNEGNIPFFERNHMLSSTDGNLYIKGNKKYVNTINAKEIIKIFPTPYDLIKLDIEGGEYDFLSFYSTVLEASKFVILEWHRFYPDPDKDVFLDICHLAEQRGFRLVAECYKREFTMGGKKFNTGMLLLESKRQEKMELNILSQNINL